MTSFGEFVPPPTWLQVISVHPGEQIASLGFVRLKTKLRLCRIFYLVFRYLLSRVGGGQF